MPHTQPPSLQRTTRRSGENSSFLILFSFPFFAQLNISDVEETRQDSPAVDAEVRFGVELDTEVEIIPVAQSHHNSVFGPGGDFEAFWPGLAFHDQGMVPGGFETVSQSFEDPGSGVKNRGRFPVNRLGRPHHASAAGDSNRLVAKANPE